MSYDGGDDAIFTNSYGGGYEYYGAAGNKWETARSGLAASFVVSLTIVLIVLLVNKDYFSFSLALIAQISVFALLYTDNHIENLSASRLWTGFKKKD